MALIRGGMSIPRGEREAPGEEKAPEAVFNQDSGVFLTKLSSAQVWDLAPAPLRPKWQVGGTDEVYSLLACQLS